MKAIGTEFEFLKRRYIRVEAGVAVYSNTRYLEALLKELGSRAKVRDSPADGTFQDEDDSKELDAAQAKVYKESVGRLLYLGHSRPDIQYSVCVLSGKMAKPTAKAFKWLLRVVGYLAGATDLGFLIKPVTNGTKFSYDGPESYYGGEGMVYIIEAITDADWAGCKRSRRSRSAIQLYIGGGLVGSMVRSQRSIALSSAESEYIAMIGGACEGIYLADCLKFVLKGNAEVKLVCRTDSAACRGVAQRLGYGRVRHLHCAVLWVQQAVREQVLEIGSISGQENPSDIGTKPLAGPRIRELLNVMGAVTADGESYGNEDREVAVQKRAMAKAMKNLRSDGLKVERIKALLPLVLLLSSVEAAQGLSLAPVMALGFEEDLTATTILVVGVATIVYFLFVAVPAGLLEFLKWCSRFSRDQQKAHRVCEKAVQANRGMAKDEEKFMQEYVDRCVELRRVVAEQRTEIEDYEEKVRELRREHLEVVQRLREEIRELQRRNAARRVPGEISVATSRGERYHLPTCGNIRRSATRTYSPCLACLGAGDT
eukprot:s3995_g6.t1